MKAFVHPNLRIGWLLHIQAELFFIALTLRDRWVLGFYYYNSENTRVSLAGYLPFCGKKGSPDSTGSPGNYPAERNDCNSATTSASASAL